VSRPFWRSDADRLKANGRFVAVISRLATSAVGRELPVRQSDQSGALDRIKAIDSQIAMLRLVL
jgi:hypothetical protein